MNIEFLKLNQDIKDKFTAAGINSTQQIEQLTSSKLVALGLDLNDVEEVRKEYKRIMGMDEQSNGAAVQTSATKPGKETIKFDSYHDFDQTLHTELKKSAEGFVRIGYLLKLARDTDILQESGFESVAEYAKEKYGLSKDVVSRYIGINDKFSEDGNSPVLKEQYQGYGIAKLQEMLTMPQETLGLLSPQMTKSDIVTVKKEIEEEKAITPLEAMVEEMEVGPIEGTLLEQFWKEYFHLEPELFCKLWSEIVEIYSGRNIGKLLDIIEPSGIGVKTARIKGLGKLMASIKGEDMDVELMNARTMEKQVNTWNEIIQTLANLIGSSNTGDAKKTWEQIYQEEYPKKEEVAPVQQKEETHVHQRQEPARREIEQPATKQANKKTVAKAETKDEANGKQEKAHSEEKVEEQVPGQTEITKDFPEYCPENAEKTESEQETEVHEITENVVQEGMTVRDMLLSGDEEKIRKVIAHKFGQAYEVDTIWDTWMGMIINV